MCAIYTRDLDGINKVRRGCENWASWHFRDAEIQNHYVWVQFYCWERSIWTRWKEFEAFIGL